MFILMSSFASEGGFFLLYIYIKIYLMSEIIFKENSSHQVIMGIPSSINLSGYEGNIQVKTSINSKICFEFKTSDDTLIISGTNIILNIPSSISLGRSGKYKYQLKLINNDNNVIMFDIFDFTIESSLNLS